jgi:hypothetical protein
MSRFERIARDLEKLPVELHKGVLVDLEFQQLIRLSQHAGPRLVISLQDNISPWGLFFRDGNDLLMQRLLALTDRLAKLCFKLPKSKDTFDSDYDTFEYASYTGPLYFFRNRGSEWEWRSSNDRYPYTPQLVDAPSLSSHWLSWLNELVVNTTWKAFHVEYSRLIEPWIIELDGAAAIFGKIPFFGQTWTSYQNESNLTEAKRNALSLEELSKFTDLYQQLRVIRAKALAEELYRLADLYDAHSSRLKMPFAPQTLRRNKQHIPTNMRYEARKVIKRASTTWWKSKEKYPYRFAYQFPALIPYDWTIQLFRKVLQDGLLSESLYPEAVVNCKRIVQGIPQWVPDLLRHFKTDEMVNLSKALDLVALEPKDSSMWQNTYRPHPDDELRWLEGFAEVVAWMELKFPDELQKLRDHHRDSTAS